MVVALDYIMSFTETANISFDQIFGSEPENVSIEKLESLLDQVVSDSFKNSSASPNELVRVMDQNGIRWMTADEAETYARTSTDNQDETLKRSVQHALRCDSNALGQELRIVFLLANSTLKKYREKKLISIGEIQRTEPMLTRLGRQVTFDLASLREVENRIKDIRQKHPVLSEFENKMGLLLRYQKKGETAQAAMIAKELAAIKNTYIRFSRGMTSDRNESNHCRLELQNRKKSILSCHKYLAAQREGVLQEEIQDLRSSVESLKSLLAKSTSENKERYETTLNFNQSQLSANEVELTIVQKERTILEIKEKETSAVISQMESVVQSDSLMVKKQEAPPAPVPDQPTIQPQPEPQEIPKTKLRRMHTADRRER